MSEPTQAAETAAPTDADEHEHERERQAAARALRNLEAAEARLRRDTQRVHDETRAKLVVEILPVLDNLDRTIRAAEGASNPALLQGVRMVRDQLDSVLSRYGVETIDATDQVFDPNLHESVGVIPVSDSRWHGMVAAQDEPGYRFAGKLLRPAKVYVGKLVT